MKKRSALALAALVLAGGAAVLARSGETMEERVRETFFRCQDSLQAEVDACFREGKPLAYAGDWKAVNLWNGEMAEYVTHTRGSAYYGFYYTPADEPRAFQNTAAELIPEGDGWLWFGEGDDCGRTRRLAPGWYYFEASF